MPRHHGTAPALPLLLLTAASLLPALPGSRAAAPPRGGQGGEAAEAPLPAGAFARLGTSRLRHVKVISGLAFAPGGKTVVTGSFEGTIRYWDVATGRETRLLQGVGGRFALSPNGEMLATTAAGGRIVLRDPATGAETASLGGHTAEVTCLAFSPDGKSLVSGSNDRTVRLWEVSTAQQRWVGKAGGEVRWVAFSHDGKRVASGGMDNLVSVWDAAGGRKERSLAGHTSRVTSVAFTPDGKSVVSTSWDRSARVWDLAGGKQARAFLHQAGPEAVAVSPDGKSLAVLGGGDNTLYLWDLTSAEDRLLWKGRHYQGLRLAFSPDGKLLASAGWDNTVRLWDVAAGRLLPPCRRPVGHDGWVQAVLPLPGGRGIVSAGSDGQVLLWDAAGRRVVRRFEGHTHRVWCLACSPDGRTLASGASDRTIRVWDVASGRELLQIEVKGQVKGLAFSPDGRRLASAVGEDRHGTWMPAIPGAEAQVWDAVTGAWLLGLEGHAGGVKTVAFAPDGRTLATAGLDGTVRVWDAVTGKERRRLSGGKGTLESVAFSPDGGLIAATGQDQKVWLWRAESGQRLFELPGPKGWGMTVAFSPDGRTLISASFGDAVYGARGRLPANPLRLWDVASGQERARFGGHQGSAHAAAFTADGTAIVSGGGDGTLLLWDLTGRRIGVEPAPAESAWEELLADNAAVAHRAIWSLVARPKQALPLLRDALRPVPGVDQARVAKLIRELDDDSYPVRERATEELEEAGEPAAPALREAAKKSPSAEVRDRAGRLLGKLSAPAASPERLRARRALEVLEHLEGPEAAALLKSLAAGNAEAALTREARAMLGRREKKGR
jgi:WD40 repeat protein